jgi:exodeoxyribonuclease V alpha subunit
MGLMPDLTRSESGEFHFVDAADPEDGVRKMLAVVRKRIPKRFGLDPIRDIQVLCPMNRGGLGARSLNIELQQALNPPGDIRIDRFGWTFCPGDKIMQVENDHDKDVYNGDLGIVSSVDIEEGELDRLEIILAHVEGSRVGTRCHAQNGERRAPYAGITTCSAEGDWSGVCGRPLV